VSYEEMLIKHSWNHAHLRSLILTELSGVIPDILVHIGLRTHHTHTHTHTRICKSSAEIHSGLIFLPTCVISCNILRTVALCNTHDSHPAGPTAAKPDTLGPRLHRRQTFSRTKKNSDTHT
jgi:hypothetical protein